MRRSYGGDGDEDSPAVTPSRKSHKTSKTSSPSRSPAPIAEGSVNAESTPALDGELRTRLAQVKNEEEQKPVKKDLRKGLQAAMRIWCHRRDQVCVVTGETDDDILKVAHVLTVSYGKQWVSLRMRATVGCSYISHP